MINVYLFDWGDTLMVDFPDSTGKMCEWEVVEAVTGAKETLEILSKNSQIYVATGATNSKEVEIQRAFERVNLSQYISGYFCKANLGVSKGNPDFLKTILRKLKVPSTSVAMVGDNLNKDIKPALAAGIQPYWFTNKCMESALDNVKVIKRLSALCT